MFDKGNTETMKCRYEEHTIEVESYPAGNYTGGDGDLRIDVRHVGPKDHYAFAYLTVEKSKALRKMLKRAEKRAVGE